MSLVYKYLPPERATYVENQLLRFSQPAALNDPYECLPALPDDVYEAAVEAVVDELGKPVNVPNQNRKERRRIERTFKKMAFKSCRQLRANPGHFSSILVNRFYKQTTKGISSLLCILSLSSRWDSGLMWSHYAQSHSGFCVGFRRDHPLFLKQDAVGEMKLGLRPVRYSANRTCIKNRRLTEEEARDILFVKSMDWSYEKEERLIARIPEAKLILDATPYPIALFEVPHEAIGEIIIGIRTTTALKTILTALADRLGIPVFQAELSRTTFDLERRCIC